MPQDKRAFLVLGPESSGTRLMTKLLIAAGCYGDDGHEQRLDCAIPADEPLVVWRRSVPHRKEWIRVREVVARLSDAGYSVTAIVMSRDWHALGLSQVQAPHVADVETATANAQRAYCLIFGSLSATNTPFEVVNYEAIVSRPQATVAALMRRLGLAEPEGTYLYDGNAKYYDSYPSLEELSREMVS